MSRQYPPHFRREMANRRLAGESALSLVQETSRLDWTLPRRKRQALVDVGVTEVVKTGDSAQLQADNKCIIAL